MSFTQAKSGMSYAHELWADWTEARSDDTEASSKSPIQTPELFGAFEMDDELYLIQLITET